MKLTKRDFENPFGFSKLISGDNAQSQHQRCQFIGVLPPSSPLSPSGIQHEALQTSNTNFKGNLRRTNIHLLQDHQRLTHSKDSTQDQSPKPHISHTSHRRTSVSSSSASSEGSLPSRHRHRSDRKYSSDEYRSDKYHSNRNDRKGIPSKPPSPPSPPSPPPSPVHNQKSTSGSYNSTRFQTKDRFSSQNETKRSTLRRSSSYSPYRSHKLSKHSYKSNGKREHHSNFSKETENSSRRTLSSLSRNRKYSPKSKITSSNAREILSKSLSPKRIYKSKQHNSGSSRREKESSRGSNDRDCRKSSPNSLDCIPYFANEKREAERIYRQNKMSSSHNQYKSSHRSRSPHNNGKLRASGYTLQNRYNRFDGSSEYKRSSLNYRQNHRRSISNEKYVYGSRSTHRSRRSWSRHRSRSNSRERDGSYDRRNRYGYNNKHDSMPQMITIAVPISDRYGFPPWAPPPPHVWRPAVPPMQRFIRSPMGPMRPGRPIPIRHPMGIPHPMVITPFNPMYIPHNYYTGQNYSSKPSQSSSSRSHANS